MTCFVASGEQVAIALVVIALGKLGVPAKPLLAYQLGIETDNVYSKARIPNIRTAELENLLAQNIVPVIAGLSRALMKTATLLPWAVAARTPRRWP